MNMSEKASVLCSSFSESAGSVFQSHSAQAAGSAAGNGRLLVSVVAAGTLLLCSMMAQAQEAAGGENADALESVAGAGDVQDLNPVVVTGSRTERNVKEVPATVQVIDEKELEVRQVFDIREAVEDVPNVEVPRSTNRMAGRGSGGRANNAGFNIRGLTGNRVLILVDGVRAPRSYNFGGSSRDNFDLGLIERLEVKKGPSSAQYGSDGIGGVVQFFTPDPQRYIAAGDRFGGTAHLTRVGENDGWRVGSVVAAQFTPEFSGLLGVSHMAHHALENMGENNSPNASRTQPNPEDATGTGVLGKLVYQPDPRNRHVFALEHVNKKTDLDLLSENGARSRGGVVRTSGQGSTDNSRTRLSWDGMFGVQAAMADTLHTRLSYQKFDSHEHYRNTRTRRGRPLPGQIRNVDDEENSWELSARAEKTLPVSFGAHAISYGMDYSQIKADNLQTGKTPPRGEKYPVKRFPDTTEKSTGVYVQDEILGNGWSVTPALRYDRFDIDVSQSGFGLLNGVTKRSTAVSKSGSNLSPSIGATVDLNDQWTLYGQWSTGYRTPSADELNRYFENPLGGYQVLPNPDLEPEKAKHTEIGIKGGVGSKWRFTAALFQGKYKEFIKNNQRVRGTGRPGDPMVFQAINIDRATIKGFELEGEYRFDRNRRGGIWSLPFSYGQAKGTDDNSGRPLDSVQPARTRLGVRYEQNNWLVGLDATHRAGKSASDVENAVLRPARGGRPAVFQFLPPASTTLDLYGQWTFKRSNGKQVRLSAGIENLTDKKYWHWSSVTGLAQNHSLLDAYTQPGRSVNIRLSVDF